MSRSSGTGSPFRFRCHMARKSWHAAHRLHPEALVRVLHEVTLTGRTRPYRNRYHAIVGRSTVVAREYRCTCGHVGWSNHSDLSKQRDADATWDAS